jgi:hypothetical protein
MYQSRPPHDVHVNVTTRLSCFRSEVAALITTFTSVLSEHAGLNRKVKAVASCTFKDTTMKTIINKKEKKIIYTWNLNA